VKVGFGKKPWKKKGRRKTARTTAHIKRRRTRQGTPAELLRGFSMLMGEKGKTRALMPDKREKLTNPGNRC